MSRVSYYRRIFAAYLLKGNSQLTFWHDNPKINETAFNGGVGEYYQDFSAKALYAGPYDDFGIPLLDYHGRIGKQYNPIAIAQYGLGHYNLFRQGQDGRHREAFLRSADWLREHLERNDRGLWVWRHHFDWEYWRTLKAPWYSALAQGQGISALIRAHLETGDRDYLEATERAFEVFKYEVQEGGVAHRDRDGYLWLEEYIVDPPSHILNGFIWALWGIYDYLLFTGDCLAEGLFQECLGTLEDRLPWYDAGFWSLYDLSPTWLKTLASPFYHHLHIAQLEILYRLTGRETFLSFSKRWDRYAKSPFRRNLALAYKGVFKLLYY